MKIMAALDQSDYADFVLTKAIKTAWQQNAKLDIVMVVEEEAQPKSGELNGDDVLQETTRIARDHQQKALNQGVKAKIRVFSGTSAAEEIIKYQQAEKLDLIVLGRRAYHVKQGKSPIGAVCQAVAAYATCTVMIVRCMEKRDFEG